MGTLSDSPSGCEYSHKFKASCDLSATAKPPAEYQLFSEEPNWGSDYADVGFCPMKSKNQVSCADVTQSPTLRGEIFSQQSKCFETDSIQSVCLHRNVIHKHNVLKYKLIIKLSAVTMMGK